MPGPLGEVDKSPYLCSTPREAAERVRQSITTRRLFVVRGRRRQNPYVSHVDVCRQAADV